MIYGIGYRTILYIISIFIISTMGSCNSIWLNETGLSSNLSYNEKVEILGYCDSILKHDGTYYHQYNYILSNNIMISCLKSDNIIIFNNGKDKMLDDLYSSIGEPNIILCNIQYYDEKINGTDVTILTAESTSQHIKYYIGEFLICNDAKYYQVDTFGIKSYDDWHDTIKNIIL